MKLPTYKELAGIVPDLPGSPQGLQPGYLKMPSPITIVKTPAITSGRVTGLTETFDVAKNPAGGKELLRTMLSKEAASNFAKTILAPTIVKDTVPADGFGSTALVSQTKMLDAAGENVFDIRFSNVYGLNKDQLVTWNSFLDGKIDAAGLTADLQKISDKVANDKSVTKIDIK